MEPGLILLILRLLGAAVLLGFLGAIAWLIYRDMQATVAVVAAQGERHGQLRVVANEAGQPKVGTTYPLQPITSIGRASSNSVVLDDTYTSSQHALITRRGELWWLEDMGSRNGMLLNDLPLEEAAVVSAGDIITIGQTQLKIEF